MNELQKILDEHEKVLWEGKPKFWPFFLGGSIITTLIGLFMMIFFVPFMVVAFIAGKGIFRGILLLPHFWVAVVLFFGIPLYLFLVYKHMHYAITNKRVLLQKGLIGRDFEMVDFDQITNAEVRVGVLDKLFGRNSGIILISTAGTFTYTRRGRVQKPYTLRNIESPYEIFKFFKKVSHAVKTDIQYPNKYRPKTNPGYKTEYHAKK